MALRFYAGGPRAVGGPWCWEAPGGIWGCEVARRVGVCIPPSTYRHGKWTDYGDYLLGGGSYTAILPLEE